MRSSGRSKSSRRRTFRRHRLGSTTTLRIRRLKASLSMPNKRRRSKLRLILTSRTSTLTIWVSARLRTLAFLDSRFPAMMKAKAASEREETSTKRDLLMEDSEVVTERTDLISNLRASALREAVTGMTLVDQDPQEVAEEDSVEEKLLEPQLVVLEEQKS